MAILNIAQIQTKYGIIERECYSKPKDDIVNQNVLDKNKK